jgi:hypothetical protein
VPAGPWMEVLNGKITFQSNSEYNIVLVLTQGFWPKWSAQALTGLLRYL